MSESTPEDVLVRGSDGVRAVKTLPHRVERAGADVAVHHPHGRECQCCDVCPTGCGQGRPPMCRRG